MAGEEQLRAYLKKVTGELREAHRQVRELELRDLEPIAIVGLSCRYPGGVATPEEFWRLLDDGVDAITEFPTDRGWDTEGTYDPDPERAGKSYTREGGFLHDAGDFDAAFFGIGRREALAIDPQQRLLLECVWEAVEDAGLDPTSLRGSATGVFAGVLNSDYAGLGSAFAAPEVEGYLATGVAGSVASGRLAYTLGLEGPAVSIDTACSSSLVAMHLAIQALRGGECELALAGGVTVAHSIRSFVEFSRQRALSPDGRCRAFAADADGAGWSEGTGILLLQRLSDAEAQGRRIHAVVRGSATNQDGASNGLTAPNGPSQERVIRQALANAGLKPSEVDAVEAHGTGTPLGDPIEANALLATYGQEREGGGPLALGSLKSNVGHTLAAAGVGGVIKMVLALKEEELPPTLHVDEPTPHVDWEAGEIELLREPKPWPRGERPRRAGVSSFGISGTNAHLIVEEAPVAPAAPEPAERERPPAIPWALSAKSPEALREAAGRLAAHVEAGEPDPVDVAHTLLTARASFAERGVVVGADRAELLAGLDALAADKGDPGLVTGKVLTGKSAFLFSGQGSQRPGMGQELYEAFPVYAESFDRACETLSAELGLDLKEAIFAPEGSEAAQLLDRTDHTQAALFALQVALFDLLASFGLQPDYLIGHSIGEVSAAHIAGVLDLEDAAKLVAARGSLMAALPEGGAMAAIRGTEAEVTESLAGFEGKLGIAAINSPTSIVVSGDEDALEGWRTLQEERGNKTRRLRVSHAFHSHRMEPMLAEFKEQIAELDFKAPQIPILSNLDGEILSEERATSPAYWVQHVREPVRFAAGIGALAELGVSRYLELGPDATLTALAAEGLPDPEAARLAAALRKDRPEAQSLVGALGALHCAGAEVDWAPLFTETGATTVDLPTYPFQRQRYWLQPSSAGSDPSSLGQAATEHPLLGASIALASEGSQLFTGRLSLATHPWLADHAIAGTAILPGAALAELALRAGAEVGATYLQELVLEAPLLVPETGAVQLQLTLEAGDDGHALAIYSRPQAGEEDEEEQPFTRHASGTLIAQETGPSDFDATAWPPAGAEPIDTEGFYDTAAQVGLDYGPAFQGLEAAWRVGEEIYAEVSLAPEQGQEAGRFAIHPALLDAALHPGLLNADPEQGMRLPFSFAGFSLIESNGPSSLRVRVRSEGEGLAFAFADQDGLALGAIESLALRAVDPSQLQVSAKEPDSLFAIEWTEVELGEGEAEAEIYSPEVPAGDSAEATHVLTAAVLEAIQAFLADEERNEDRLAILTQGAVATEEGESPDLAQASLWGLVRSAQSEHPGRFLLVDSDGSETSAAALPAALANLEEPQLALREGRALAPRLGTIEGEVDAVPASLDPEGTVLITGGLSGLGSLTARHLASIHGAKQLLLVSRRGPESPEAEALVAELAELGCEAKAEACDVSDREQLESLLAAIPAEHPLRAVVHSAGTLDDALFADQSAEGLGRVLAPKADAAWHLHELTKELALDAFVLFSSGTATLGNPGQANYAAANAFLDALAQRRRAERLPGTAIAWGPWEQESELTQGLGPATRSRFSRGGVIALSNRLGLTLFDRARGLPDPLVVAAPLETAALREAGRAGLLPPLFSGLVPTVRRRVGTVQGSFARRLAGMAEREREELLLELVREHAAAILGLPSVEQVDPRAAFKDLGFDSLGAVELRNRLSQATGVTLEPTLVFDRPHSAAVAAHLLGLIEGKVAAAVTVRAATGTDEPIAIVGLGCRYPGGVDTPERLWELLAAGRDGITEFPGNRGWDVERLYDPDPDRVGKSYVREGGFLHDVAEFDAGFFGIGPREALAMDTQQRLLLECAWEALEDAGIDPATLRGSPTGVFAGVMYHDYASGGQGATSPEVEGFLSTGLSGSVASGRVAYNLGLEGPAITVDTACSSSLVTMHLAAQALRGGECDLALAGGVTVMATPGVFTGLSRQRALSPDGRCKSFAAGADGTGWSEGSGLVVLQRLSDAVAAGHRIHAVVRGSATNQDGASNGLTAPNGPSQERVIRQALANAGLKPSEVDAVEAHGTGTPLGDPIEAGALLATYGQEREGEPLVLGSLKSNIGHTQAAAGVGGVIKMVLALRHEELPRTLHVDEPTPHVDWEAGEIQLLTEPRPWPRSDERPRRAGVSSFGISGTNAHLIVEEPPLPFPASEVAERERPPAIPWALSAKSPEALREAAGRLAAHVEANEPDPVDVAHTLLTARASFAERAVVVGSEEAELMAGLDALARGGEHSTVSRARALSRPKVAFVFPGQGSQWAEMARALLQRSPVFAARIAECEAALAPYLEWSPIDLLSGAEGAPSLGRIEVVQPTLFAVAVSLAELWRSFGVEPAGVVGHSQGEIPAAVFAGAISLEDGARLAALRSQAIGRREGEGAMVSVALSAERLRERLGPWDGEVELAAINGPGSVTVACGPGVVEGFLASCEEEGVRARAVVAGNFASHSRYVDQLREEMAEALAPVAPASVPLPFYSTLTGEPIDTAELGPEYWYRNMREPVQFEGATRRLLADGFTALIEISSHPVLALALGETVADAVPDQGSVAILNTLRRDEGGLERFVSALAAAQAHGVAVDWSPLFAGAGARVTELPTYPFQRERFWLEAGSGSGDAHALGLGNAEHPMLGASIALADEGRWLFTGAISRATHPWLEDHAVTGIPILPGTGFVELALRAGAEVGAEHLEELVLGAPLFVPETGAVQLQVALEPREAEGGYEITIHSRPQTAAGSEAAEERPWTRHAGGVLTSEPAPAPDSDAASWPPAGAEPVATDAFYDFVAEIGIDYGPAFQGLTAAWRSGGELFAEISLAPDQAAEAQRFGIHPALLDAALHTVYVDADPADGLRMPFGFGGVDLHGDGGASALRIRLAVEGERVSLQAADGDGVAVVSVRSLTGRPLDPAQLRGEGTEADPFLVLDWAELELPAPVEAVAGGNAKRLLEAVEASAGEPPPLLIYRCPSPEDDGAPAARALCAEALAVLQAFLAAEQLGESRLAIVTEGATQIGPDAPPELAVAPVWALVRSAQSEHPGRFTLIDSDGSTASEGALAAALAVEDEPQLALRDGDAAVPRLVRPDAATAPPPRALDPEGTVLVTGGLTGMGALVARHLAAEHGARHLLLLGRRGAQTPGAGELIAELGELGCEAEAVACDVSEREQLAAVLAAIPAERPLTAVVHSAGTAQNALIESQDEEGLARVFAPKADAAWHLHELTRDLDLASFVLFSSTAGTFYNPGMANYAAANAFLDALARRRHEEGLAATSISWGLWLEGSELAQQLRETDLARLRREGFGTLSSTRLLELFDRAPGLGQPHVLATPLELPTLRSLARAELLPPLLFGLVPAARRRARRGGGSLARRLATVPEAERESLVLALVREHAAAVLGHSSPDAVETGASFKDLGFDSLGAVELRNRLAQATGATLDATLVFDYPTPAAVATHLVGLVGGKVEASVAARPARGSEEPIAIVGLSCRLPGGVSTPEGLWELLAAGGDGITEFPGDRGWDVEGFYDPELKRAGTSYVREGGFLHDAAEFDAGFFGIGPREALTMDPQQRLLLECAWEALEDAGVDPAALRGSATGVFAGVMNRDYAGAGFAPVSIEHEGFLGLGSGGSIASGRLAYTLGLEGPAVTIDTACSSSLVAMHLAGQALRSGECDLALAGGVMVMSSPGMFTWMSRQRGLSPDGRCKSFAAAADGTGVSEGSGILLLQRLSEAEAQGRRIHAVIRGSATNQDGASNGLTAPNGPSQERVIRQALANAGLKPGEVDAVEAHGTGTTLGDPIEAGALLATYGREREHGPLALGSLKSNLGHTQAAAGVAAVIKMALALSHEELPPTLHIDEPTPHVDWEAGEIELLTEAKPWPRGERPRRAGVSSFGMSGTNAHLILEEAPAQSPIPEAEEAEEAERPPAIPWALSAKSPEALREAAGRLAAHVEAGEPDPLDVAHTLLTARASFAERAVVAGADQSELMAGLDALAAGKGDPGLVQGKTLTGKSAFLFSGQGSQRAEMGKELSEAFPAYAESFDRACAALSAELGLDLKEAIFAPEGSEAAQLLDRTDHTQAALFALQVALHDLLSSFGLAPDYLIGHSIGEVTAAHIAGVLDLKDAAKLVAARGSLMAALPEGGAMAAIRGTEAEVEESLEGFEGKLGIAAINAPTSIVVSGDEDALEGWRTLQEERGNKTRRLRVSHAFHSHRMEPMLAEFEERIGDLEFKVPQIPVLSNLDGELLTEERATSPAYWAQHVREPVRFAAGIGALAELGVSRYLELGPDATLTALAAEGLPDPEAARLAAALRKDRPEAQSLISALGTLHCAGAEVDFSPLFKDTAARTVDLPTYPFQRQRYWLQPGSAGSDPSSLGQTATEHPLLGASIALASEGSQLFTGRLSLATHPWLADHAIGGTAILPGAALAELALRAGAEVGANCLQELVLETPLLVPATGAVQLQLTLEAEEQGEGYALAIYSRPQAGEEDEEEQPFTRHASGTLIAQETGPSDFDASAWPPAGAEPIDTEGFYDTAAQVGLDYGPAFQGLEAAWRAGEEIYAEVSLAPEQGQEAGRFAIHPALLDAALHPGLLNADPEQGMRLPFSFAGFSLIESNGPSSLRVRVRSEGEGLAFAFADQDGLALGAIESLALRAVDPSQLQVSAKEPDSLFAIEWTEVELGEGEAEAEIYSPEVPAGDSAEATHVLTAAVLEAIQAFLADEERNEDRLAILTQGAVATEEGESPDLAQASLWGLVRSAQSEHPGRFLLVDSDGSETSAAALPAALANLEEPQLALREGRASAPRLAPLTTAAEEEHSALLDPDGTVLLTGGLSGLGALTARHLAGIHGAKHLLLVSRRGPESPDAEALVAELAALGCEARAAAGDVSDREQLESLLAAIPAAHPLTAVVHCAGAVDDALFADQSAKGLERVLAPKADAAWHLHELTRELDLDAFVLFSSAAGTFYSPGQANYAAANAFLDALAQRRRAEGLPATAIAWGPWDRRSELSEGLDEIDLARLSRLGFAALAPERGLSLFDRASSQSGAFVLAASLDTAALRAAGRVGLLPPLLSGLVPSARRRAKAAQGSLAHRLATVPEAERAALVLALVREQVATVLGHGSGEAIDPAANFKDLGFDSLGAVELRNRLAQATGAALDATLVFDYPSAEAVAGYLLSQAVGTAGAEVVVRAATGSDEPIAIVGLGCRYPGGVETPEQLWRLVAEGRDGVTEFPDDRGWDVEGLYDPDPDRAGKTYAREGGFLHEAAEFDAAFFGISPREAIATDPQQRLLLECAWEALEDAGIDPAALRGSGTGVFAGLMHHDYTSASSGAASLEVEAMRGLGHAGSLVSGRVAYTLGLEGPALTVDTACSSSLVALHLAAQALRGGECDLALAGGVTVLATPNGFVEFSRQRAMAPDGRCKSFAAAADGTGWSEGSGILLLQRLSEAEAQGRRIHAVIRGSATNQDGASNGLTAPNGPSQERVIRQALANAGLKPAEVDAVEAHGTGTTLGDPIEANALLATYGQEREGGPLALGSLKSNIGHTQAAAGVGGVIKMVLALREEELPRTLHVDEPTPHVDWEAGEVELLTEPRAWPRGERARRAGVSSFGVSGTNAHLILEEAPMAPPATEQEDRERPPAIPWALSAKTPEALVAAAGRLAAHVETAGPDPLDVAHTLHTARASFQERAVVVGSEQAELLAGLDALATGREHPALIRAKAISRSKVAFVFPGQGSQWAGMARELLDRSPVFAAKIAECEAALAPFVDFSLSEVLRSEDDGWLERIEVVQPVLFAAMVALAELWRSFGVEPGAVVGHSQGEIAAAVVAGALSLEDGARLTALRAKALIPLMGRGDMASFLATPQELEPMLEPYGERVAIAALNGPRATVLSGEPDALRELIATAEENGLRARLIAVGYASHCSQIDALQAELAERFASVQAQETTAGFYSTLSGEPIQTTELDAEYWYRNLREPVQFERATRALIADGFTTLIEISAHPVLAMALGETAEDALGDPAAVAVLHTLRREEGGLERFLASLASAHAHGVAVDWTPLFEGTGAATVDLPTYPFQRQRFWLAASGGAGDLSAAGQADAEHPLLGASIALAEGSQLFTGRLSLATHPWLADHAISGTAILPGTAFAELALRAGAEVGAERLEELILEAPLAIPEVGAVQLQVAVEAREGEEGVYELAIHSRPERPDDEEPAWTRHASGVLVDEESEPPDFPSSWPPPGAEPIDGEALYDLAVEVGLDYGPAFQGLEAAWRVGEEICAEVSLAAEQTSEAQRFGIHPALLDAALHPSLVDAEPGDGVPLPFSFAGVFLYGGAGASALRVRISRGEGAGNFLTATDPDGTPVVSIAAIAARPVDPSQLQLGAKEPDSLFALQWAEVKLGEPGEDRAPTQTHTPEIPKGDRAQAAQSAAAGALEAIQAFLADPERAESRLAILTEGAMAVGEEESPDPAAASLWGLVRSAQSEHPGRLLLIDSDASEASTQALPAALADPEEPQLALREGVAFAPRLAPVGAEAEAQAQPLPLDPEGSVLITGGLTGVGALSARHLAKAHGAKHLLLVSRRGPEAPGAKELLAELSELGCEAEAVACDVSDRAQLQALLKQIPESHPLKAVIHSAVVLDDGVIDSLDPERLARVMGPKASAAWHLHELTRDMELDSFVLYSSGVATFGNPGQGNYAAANAFLDALAQQRQAEGLPGVAIGWGLWEQESEMTAGLDEANRARVSRGGLIPLPTVQGLELFDRARALRQPFVIAAPLDRGAFRELDRAGMLPPLLSRLVPTGRRRARGGGDSLARRLAGVPEAERQALVLALVREHVATVLGHSSPDAVDPEVAFKDLGFDSLGAVELRNRLSQATGMRLEATLVFDYPNATAVATHLLDLVEPRAGAGASVEEAEILARIAAIPVSRLRDSGLLEMVLALENGGEAATEAEADAASEIDAMDIDSLVRQTLGPAASSETSR